MVVAQSNHADNIYYVKVNQGKSPLKKNQNKKSDCEIKTSSDDEIVCSKIINEKQVLIVRGSVYAFKKQVISLVGEDGEIQKSINLGQIEDSNKKQKAAQNKKEEYNVMGLEGEVNQHMGQG